MDNATRAQDATHRHEGWRGLMPPQKRRREKREAGPDSKFGSAHDTG